MSRLNTIDPATANGETKELLEGIQKKLGLTPNVLRTLANSPAALKTYLATSEALSTGRLDAKSREAIALTVAGANNCQYCASAHTAISKGLKVDEPEIERRLGGHSADPALDAALVFAAKVVDKQGWVGDEDLREVRAAGHDDEVITEIVANVVANILTNYINHIADTEIDFPKVELNSREAA
ncbi:MAG: carboxymuconolactone decarboxylase family protein [Geminicoccaceae bacterium]